MRRASPGSHLLNDSWKPILAWLFSSSVCLMEGGLRPGQPPSEDEDLLFDNNYPILVLFLVDHMLFPQVKEVSGKPINRCLCLEKDINS